MTQYVLDGYAMIAFFEGEPGAQQVEKILRRLLHAEAAVLSMKLKATLLTGDIEFKIPADTIDILWSDR
jgi:PIN domain nuclease of toxin-antitoxin system